MTPRWVRVLPWLACATLVVRPLQAEVLTLEDALRLAREHNPTILAARQTWRAAQGRALEARALPDPEFELELDGMPTVSGAGDAEERFVGVSQRLGWPGEWRQRGRAARKAAEAVRLSALVTTELEVSARVAVAWHDVLRARQVLAFQRDNRELTRGFLQRARLRLDAGDVPELEVLRAEVEAGRAASSVAAATNDLEIARGRLNVLLARDAGADLQVAGELAYEPVDTELAQLQRLAFERRPEVLAASLTVESLRAGHAAERAAVIPDVTVGLARQTIRQPGGDDNRWRVGLGLEIPLWAAWRQRGRLATAAAEVARAEAESQRTRLQVGEEVRSARLDLLTAAEQVEVYRDRIVREAEAAQRAAQRSYDEGKAAYLEVLEAQRTLVETRVEYADRLFAHREAVAALERATGGELPK